MPTLIPIKLGLVPANMFGFVTNFPQPGGWSGVFRYTWRFAMVLAMLSLEPRPASSQSAPATLPNLRLSSAGIVTAMAVQSDGKIVIAGSFRSVNDVARPGLARLNSDGSLDLTWKPLITILSQQPLSSVVVAGTNIYICGGVFLVNNNQTDQRAIARLSILDGTTDQTWNPGFNGGVISTMAVSAGNVYVGGTFTSVGSLPRNGLARLDLDGTVDLG